MRAHVLIALQAYAKRGEAALSALDTLQKVGAEAFFAALRQRDAAFHNFRALIAKAEREGYRLDQDPVALSIWDEIKTLNLQLADKMEAAKLQLGGQLAKLSAARNYAMACHSGTPAPRLLKPT